MADAPFSLSSLPRWLRPAPAYPQPPLSPVRARRIVRLAAETDPDAARAWAAHVDAGRIGVPAPPAAQEGDHCLAALARILGHAA